MKLQLVVDRTHGIASMTEAAPFVKNERAMFIHRPRIANFYRLKGEPMHLGVSYYCGNQSVGTDIHEFLNQPPDAMLVCEVCEVRAIMAGLAPSDILVGRHVHLGRMKPIQTCCQEPE